MSRYLVVDFDRYDTECSVNKFVEADSPQKAFEEFTGDECDEDMMDHPSDNFSCVSGEENDFLIYLV